jgi:RNA polymerase sigma factor (sigma-70 family)
MEPTVDTTFESFPFSSLTLPPAGDAGWEDIVREHEGMMRARIWRLFERVGQPPGKELVEEIVQEVYCRLFGDALKRWRGRSVRELLAFMGTIAERTVVDHLRKVQATKRTGIREICLGRRIELIPDPRDPEQDLLLAESRSVVLRRCLDAPSRRGRRNVWVARMALLEGYTNQEIAQAAGGRLSPANVACLVHRLRRRLARHEATPVRPVRRRGRRRAV